MLCPNCGNDCGNTNFCPNCGTNLKPMVQQSVEPPKKEAPKSIYIVTVNGQKIDMLGIVGKYGCDTPGVYRHLKKKYGILKEQADELLEPYVLMKAPKPTLKSELYELFHSSAEEQMAERNRRRELDASGQVYCPRCLSTSISADKKGFGIGKAIVGASLVGGIGLTAGNIGSKKVICTCLKCGYQWKAGKR